MAEAPFAPQLERLQQLVDQSNRIVFFGGAGVSTESGIPDFRSQDGLYRQQWQYPPEEIVSHSFFTARTEAFYDFYRAKMLCLEAKPNAAHLALARLEAAGLDHRVLLLSDHLTLTATRGHDGGPAPFLLYDSREDSGNGLPYTEAAGKAGPFEIGRAHV